MGMWVGCAAAGILGVLAASGQEFEITRSTVDGGGVMFSTGGEFELSGTIGQPDAGTVTGGESEFELTGGSWFGEPLDDCNSDGWVNLIDYETSMNASPDPMAGYYSRSATASISTPTMTSTCST
jgi:hypothetical protein